MIDLINNNDNRYNKVKVVYNKKFGENVGKICIDGLFTCPNRDGSVSTKGCIFCSTQGSGDHIYNYSFSNICNDDNNNNNNNNNNINNLKRMFSASLNNVDKTNVTKYIQNQITSYVEGYKGQRVNKYIVYFQNYTNTYDSLDNLKLKYDSALFNHEYSDKIVGIDIATRPDCIDEDICKLISSYSDKYYVCVELGFQTSNDNTAQTINRGYNKDVFINAIKLLNKYNIDIVVHIMVGLPNENINDLKETIRLLNTLDYCGIKIHSTYVTKNTVLESMYNRGDYIPITYDYYLDCLEYVITHIHKDIVVHRITGDCPKDCLVAPLWSGNKKLVLNGLFKRLRDNDLYQGCLFDLDNK